VIARSGRTQQVLNLLLAEFRPEQATRHAVENGVRTRLSEIKMIGRKRRPQSTADIARRWLNPKPVDRSILPERNTLPFATLESNVAGETKVTRAGACDHAVDEICHPLFGHGLDRHRNVHMGCVRAARIDVDQVVTDQLCVFGLAVGRQAYHFVLARIDFAEKDGRGRCSTSIVHICRLSTSIDSTCI
jgi:hypothetical protein